MSAMQRILPWAVSKTFVCVFTWYCGRGLGEVAWRVEVDAGRERDCDCILAEDVVDVEVQAWVVHQNEVDMSKLGVN